MMAISYLNQPDKFKWLEPEVFVGLDKIVNNPCRRRCIAALEDSGLLGGAIFHDTEVPENSSRRSWAETLNAKMNERNFVFLDPDNGIEGTRLSPKHVALSEIAALKQNGRVLIVYHHQGRRKAEVEANILMRKIMDAGWNPVELVRFRLFSSRFYVIAGHDRAIRERIKGFVNKWGEDRIMHYAG